METFACDHLFAQLQLCRFVTHSIGD